MSSKEMTSQEELELKNIVAAMICVSFPEAVKRLSEAYNEISRGILDMLLAHNISDDAEVEQMIGKVLMHAMREGMAAKLYDEK